MAIVEDEVRNESEEENDIEVVEEDDGDQDSDDSDDDDEEMEKKVADLEKKLKDDPYNYDEHMELIQTLWGLSELDRWRSAFERLEQLMPIKPEHWMLRLKTEVNFAHDEGARTKIADIFQSAALDCYSILILSEWCAFALSGTEVEVARTQLDEVLRRAGADPMSGKLFWDAKLELEKMQLDSMSADDANYKAQQERVLWCLEEAVSRPLLRGEDAWQPFQELARTLRDQEYVDKVRKQHEAATDYLQKLTPYEDRLLVTEEPEEKFKIYQEYMDTVKECSKIDLYADCDSNGILKVLYERITTECISCRGIDTCLTQYARLARECSSRASYSRVLATCLRRCSRHAGLWAMKMQLLEKEGKSFDEVKSVFETAICKGMDTYKQTEALWMEYLQYTRRCTEFNDPASVDRFRRTARLAWDSLAESWGEEANDCEVPLYWARLEYKRMNDPKQGKEIFEEIFKYGENKSMSKYWEALINLESTRDPPISENKLRDLFRRSLKFVSDYPPAVARLWTDYERDYGQLHTAVEAAETTEAKLKEWRESYQAMKDKMTGKKQKNNKDNKKSKYDKKKNEEDKPKSKGKRKSDEKQEDSGVKRKREENMDVDESKTDNDSGGGVKRSHDDDSKEIEHKRQRTDSGDARSASRDACTLFVSNLEFKVNETNLRNHLSQYGDIVSMRVRAGVKAFGGSICYCQYKSASSVDEAIKHDRTPLDGRPMFLSRYAAKKTTPQFKYPTTAEKNKLFVRNLPFASCTQKELREIFASHGALKDVRIVTFKDGKPKGLAYIEYEDEKSASQALEKTNGLLVGDRNIEVAISAPPPKKDAPTSLGLAKRDNTGGMRRTQLSSFIPSVLMKPSTSKATNGEQSNGDKRPMSNSDFRSMLLK